jgi:hypothetical protein
MPEDEVPIDENITAEEVTVSFEAMCKGLRTSQGGVTVQFFLMPNDPAVQILLEGGVNATWFCSLVRLGDNTQEADPTPSQLEGARAVRRAGILCKDSDFQSFCATHGYIPEDCLQDAEKAETKSTEFVRSWLGVVSRKQLRYDSAARARLSALTDEFYKWRGEQGLDPFAL